MTTIKTIRKEFNKLKELNDSDLKLNKLGSLSFKVFPMSPIQKEIHIKIYNLIKQGYVYKK